MKVQMVVRNLLEIKENYYRYDIFYLKQQYYKKANI